MLGSIIGGIMGMFGQNKAAKESRRAAAEANASQERIAERNIALQKEFAKSGIQWKVGDARKAGVHPLFALGANTHSFSPVSVGTTSPSIPDYGASLSQMGQGIGNAIDAASSGSQRVTRAFTALQMERLALENEQIRTNLASSRTALSRGNPPFPTESRLLAGQGNSPLTEESLAKVTPTAPHTPAFQPGVNPMFQEFNTPDGGIKIAPSQSFKSAIEDSPQETQSYLVQLYDQSVRNFTPTQPPPNGMKWEYNPVKDTWYATPYRSFKPSSGGYGPGPRSSHRAN